MQALFACPSIEVTVPDVFPEDVKHIIIDVKKYEQK